MLGALVCGAMQWCVARCAGRCHGLWLQRVAGSSRVRVIGDVGCMRPDFGGKGVRKMEVLKMSPKR